MLNFSKSISISSAAPHERYVPQKMQRELPSPSSLFREISGPLLKRPFYLSNPTERMRMQPDSSIDWLLSSKCRKLLFGRGAVELYKLQAGVKIPLWRKDYSIRITPS